MQAYSSGPSLVPGPYSANGFDTGPTQNGVLIAEVKKIFGVTKDLNSAPLGNCVVSLFFTLGGIFYQQITSDASGNYSFQVQPSTNYFAVAYLAGSPDVTGATLNTLQGV